MHFMNFAPSLKLREFAKAICSKKSFEEIIRQNWCNEGDRFFTFRNSSTSFGFIAEYLKKSLQKPNLCVALPQYFCSEALIFFREQNVNFISNFGRDIEYYTGIVFEVFVGNKEIARGGRYDGLLKSLGAKKNIPAVGAAINLKNI